MDTLSNVDNRRSGNFSPGARMKTCTISSKVNTGESVKCASDEKAYWYVLRVSYHREQVANELITSQGLETYLPLHFVKKEIEGKLKRVQEPLLPNFIFVHTYLSRLNTLIKSPINNLLSFYYNHFEVTPEGKNPPLVIPSCQMDDFIRLTSIDNDHILFISPDKCKFKNGEEVLVTDGDFEGIRGRIARIARQQRVVIEMHGIGCVATAYVPNAFIRKL